MRKKNENIHLHIINQDYKRIKIGQTINEAFMKRAEQTKTLQQMPSFAFLELKKNPTNFEATHTPAEPQQIDLTQKIRAFNKDADFDPITALENIERRTKELQEQKQNLLAIKQELINKLFKQIEAKKITINNLKSEISNLENKCETIAQSLGIPINT